MLCTAPRIDTAAAYPLPRARSPVVVRARECRGEAVTRITGTCAAYLHEVDMSIGLARAVTGNVTLRGDTLSVAMSIRPALDV